MGKLNVFAVTQQQVGTHFRKAFEGFKIPRLVSATVVISSLMLLFLAISCKY